MPAVKMSDSSSILPALEISLYELANQMLRVTCSTKTNLMAESLLDFALNVNIMDSYDEQPVFNNKDLEQEEQEYRNWVISASRTHVVYFSFFK